MATFSNLIESKRSDQLSTSFRLLDRRFDVGFNRSRHTSRQLIHKVFRMPYRIERVNALLRQEIGSVLAGELNDPRISPMVSVTQVEVSRDFSFAKVYVSVLGDEEEKENTLQALKAAAGFVHRTIKPNLSMRNVPHLVFHLDETIEKGAEMLNFIDEVMQRDREIAALGDSADPPSEDRS